MRAYALTDVGRVRAMNQDYIYSSPEPVGSLPNLFLVADGMGGHKAGDFASRYMVENLVVYLSRHPGNSVITQLKEGIDVVNRGLYEESLKHEDFYGMGTAVSLIERYFITRLLPRKWLQHYNVYYIRNSA